MPSKPADAAGRAGSGKSTFISHLALELASVALAERIPGEPQLPEDRRAQLPGWPLVSLLPVRVVLRDFAAFAPLASVARGSARLLLEFVAATLAEAQCADALEPLEAAPHEGQAMPADRWPG